MKFLRSHYFLTLATGILLVLPQLVLADETIIESLNHSAQNLVFNIVMGILGMFVWLAALILDFGINSFVIGFGDAYVNTGIGLAVDNTWVIVRDFVNLGFIFGFVYIGFMMILKSSDSNTRRWLVNIILAALLVNFSLFIVKFAIDVSNQLAAQIAINGLGSTCVVDLPNNDCLSEGGLRQVDVATEFMARLGLSQVFALTWANIDGAGWGYIFGSALLSLTAMFVFAAGGILLIIRFAVLNLFMVLSPLMFLSWIIPSVKDTMNRFWSMFIGRALFAPIYLLFIYFSLQIISGLQVSIGGNSNGFGNPDWAGTFSADKVENGAAVGDLGTFPFFILACVFMAASVVIANKLGADGGGKAVSMGKAFKNRVQGYTTRAATKPARMAAGGATRLAGAGASRLEGNLNRRLGNLAQGGWVARKAARVLDRTAGAGLRGAQNASAGGGESYNARNTRVGQQNVRLNQQNQESTRATTANTQRAAYDAAVASGNIAARRDANNAIGGQMRRMSNDEILAMVRANPALLQQAGFVQHLTDGHMTAIRDSGMLINDAHTELGNLRNESTINETAVAFEDVNATTDDLNTAFAELGQTIRNMSTERRAGLGINQLTNDNVAVHLSDRDLEGIEQSGRYTAVQMQQIREARGRGHAAIAGGTRQLATGDIAVAQGFFGQQRREMMSNAQNAGQMPVDVFTNQNMQQYLTPDAVAQRLRNGVEQHERNAIRDNIDAYINAAPNIDEQRRRTQIWQRAAQGGANSSWISGLALTSI